jgi:hypothetical protein
MLTKLGTEEITAMRKFVIGAALIADATGRPITEIVDANLPPERKPPASERGLKLVERVA